MDGLHRKHVVYIYICIYNAKESRNEILDLGPDHPLNLLQVL